MSTHQSIDAHLRAYRQALDDLPLDAPITESQVLKLFEARDAIVRQDKHLTLWRRLGLWLWDLELKGWRDHLPTSIPDMGSDKALNQKKYWWWHLSPRSSFWWEVYQKPILLICQASIAASIPLIINISSKFLTPGVDVLGAFNLVIQGLITWGTGNSLLTEKGQVDFRKFLIGVGIGDRKWHVVGMGISVTWLIILSVIAPHCIYPRLSESYLEKGQEDTAIHHFLSAKDNLERSLLFDPSNRSSQYALGQLYESMSNLGKAQEAYLILVNESPSFSDENEEQLLYLDSLIQLSGVLRQKGDYKRSMEMTKKGLKRIGDLNELEEIISNLRQGKGDRKNQESQFNILESYYDLKKLAIQKKLARSPKENLNEDNNMDRDHFHLLMSLGKTELTSKSYSDAQKSFDAAIDILDKLPKGHKSFKYHYHKDYATCLLAVVFKNQDKRQSASESFPACENLMLRGELFDDIEMQLRIDELEEFLDEER